MTASFSFAYTSGTKFETLARETAATDFYNLKNKAEGARQYGYSFTIDRATNNVGQVAYRGEYQTTLNGSRYQSSKYGAWVATEAEARALMAKTIAGALKRYAKLAQDPAKNGVERRTHP